MTGKRKTTEDFISEAKAKHGDRFDYSSVQYERSDKPVTIICRIHGPFSIQAESHLRRSNSCLVCRGGAKPKPIDKFIKQARKLHGEKYDYSQVKYEHSQSKVKIICPEHGLFEQRPSDHLRFDSKGGCPQCLNFISKRSQIWLDSLAVPQREIPMLFMHEKRKRKVDGFDPETNTVYQFHGSFWHGHPNIFCPDSAHPVKKTKTFRQIYEETMIRDNNIRESGYNLVVMWEHDFK